MEGELLAEAVLPAEPQGLLLSRGRAWADLGERAVSLSPDGRTEELELPEGHRYLVADGDGGLHSVSVQGAGLFVLPLDGGSEGFAVEGGVLGSGDEVAFLYLPGRRECTLWTPPGPGRRSWTLTPAASSRAG